jgi:flagellar basal-body rod modification protein FlgD
MTSIASAAATASTGTSSTAAASTAIGGDFNTFLKMLTTQLQNQDPTNAMDPTQMTNQLVSFAQVEQQITMNTNLNSLISLQQTQSLTTADTLVGKTVELSGTTLPLQGGAAQVKLPVAGTATAAQVQVVDSNGTVLRTQVLQLGKSATTWTWDGKTDAGTHLPDGAYTYNVAGIGPSGAALPMTATALATATGVQRQNNTLKLMFGPTGLGMDQVVSVD